MRAAAIALLALLLGAQLTLASAPFATSLLPGQALAEIRVLDSAGLPTALRYPTHIAFRGSDLIVVEGGQQQFEDPFNGNFLGRVLSLKVHGASASSTVLASRLADPMGLAIDADGSLWVSEYGRVDRIAPDGTVEVRSTGYPAFGFDATYLPGSDENTLQQVFLATGFGDLRNMDTTGTLALAFGPNATLYGAQAVNGRPPDDPLIGDRTYEVPYSSSILAIRDGPVDDSDVVARGCRNCFGLAFAPEGSPYAGRLFASENTDFYRARLQNGPHRNVLEGGSLADGSLFDGLVEIDLASGTVRRVATFPPLAPTLAVVPTGLAFAPPEFNARLAGLPIVAAWGTIVFDDAPRGLVFAVVPDEAGGVGATIPIAQGLDMPTGVTFGPDGALYVAEYSGRIVRISPAH